MRACAPGWCSPEFLLGHRMLPRPSSPPRRTAPLYRIRALFDNLKAKLLHTVWRDQTIGGRLMVKLRKNRKNVAQVGILSVALVLVFTGLACHGSAPQNQATVDNGDAKAAAARIAEADTLYAAREDLTKARVAVATLRQARTADYGNYEAACKLSRAAFYVGDHTDNDSERDDMFREGTEAGKAAVTLQPDNPDGHFWRGANFGGAAAH